MPDDSAVVISVKSERGRFAILLKRSTTSLRSVNRLNLSSSAEGAITVAEEVSETTLAFSVTTFVATVLRRFDIEMVGNPPFPKGDEGRPVLGIISIKEGQDFNVRLTPRANLV